MRVTVFVADWEIECCQPPPGAGDHVAWHLRWVPARHGAGVDDLAWDAVAASGAPAAGALDRGLPGVVLRAGPVTAWWSEGRAGQAAVPPARGRLVVDAHGQTPEAMAPVEGRVVAVDVVDQAYRRTGWRSYEPVPEDFRSRRVQRSPKRFRHGWAPEVEPVGDGRAHERQESGVLVQLDVDDTCRR